MERLRESFHEQDKIYQQDVFTWCIQGRLKIHDLTVINSHNTWNSQLARSIAFESMSPSNCAVSP